MPASETDLFAGRIGLSVDEVAGALGCHRATIYHWLSQGLLISSVIGKRRFIHRDSMVRLLSQNIEPPEASRPRTIGVKPPAAKPAKTPAVQSRQRVTPQRQKSS